MYVESNQAANNFEIRSMKLTTHQPSPPVLRTLPFLVSREHQG
jgi:hypothetical protein